MIKNAAAIMAVMLLGCGAAHAGEDFFDDLFDVYVQRIDGVTASAGDAKAVNAATHVDNPWPPYVRDRRIPGDGERMAGAVERYKKVEKIKDTPEALAPATISSNTINDSSQ
jgi:hypothetical protein